MLYVSFSALAAVTLFLIPFAFFRPQNFNRILGQRTSRKLLAALLVPLLLLSATAAHNTIPASTKIERQQAQVALDQQLTNTAPPAKAELENNAPSPTSPPTQQFYMVTQVVDGDTIKVNIDGKKETIRMIGLDTPETKDPRKPVQCFGREASNRATELLKNKKVRLERDETQADRDKYNRLLRYVYTEDGTFFNQHMIAEGYALEYTYGTPYKYQAQFRQSQSQVKSEQKGLWADDTCKGNVSSGSQPIPVPKATSAPAPQPIIEQTVPLTRTPDALASGVNYANCTAVRQAGAAPILRGQPGYSSRLDRDNDGIACE